MCTHGALFIRAVNQERCDIGGETERGKRKRKKGRGEEADERTAGTARLGAHRTRKLFKSRRTCDSRARAHVCAYAFRDRKTGRKRLFANASREKHLPSKPNGEENRESTTTSKRRNQRGVYALRIVVAAAFPRPAIQRVDPVEEL